MSRNFNSEKELNIKGLEEIDLIIQNYKAKEKVLF